MLMESPLRCTNPPPGGVARRPLPAPDPHSTTPFPLPPSVQPWGPNAARHLHVPSAGADRLRLRHRPRPGLRLPDGHRRVLLRARHEGRRRHHHPGLPDHAPGPRFHRGQFNQSINQNQSQFFVFLGCVAFYPAQKTEPPPGEHKEPSQFKVPSDLSGKGVVRVPALAHLSGDSFRGGSEWNAQNLVKLM